MPGPKSKRGGRTSQIPGGEIPVLDLQKRSVYNNDWNVMNIWTNSGGVGSYAYSFRNSSYIRVRRLMLQGFLNDGAGNIQVPPMLRMVITTNSGNQNNFITSLENLNISFDPDVNFGNNFTYLYFNPSSPGITVDWIMSPNFYFVTMSTIYNPVAPYLYLEISHLIEWQNL